jgi:hypothetical protein
MNDAVPVVLERGPQIALFFTMQPAAASAAELRARRQYLRFDCFELFADAQRAPALP